VGVFDNASNPIAGANVLLSGGNGIFGKTSLLTGASGRDSTTFSSSVTGQKAFTAQITANGGSITLTENDDLIVGDSLGYVLVKISGDNQFIPRGGTSNPFVVRVETAGGTPINGIPVSWQFDNCFFQNSGSGTLPAGESRATVTLGPTVPTGTKTVRVTIAGFGVVTFTYTVI